MSDPDFLVDADQHLPLFEAYRNFWPTFAVTRRDGRTYSVPDSTGSIPWVASVTRLEDRRVVLHTVREQGSGNLTGFSVFLTSVDAAAMRALDGKFLPPTFSSNSPTGIFCLLKPDSVTNVMIRPAAGWSDIHDPVWVGNFKLQPVTIVPRMVFFDGVPIQGAVGGDRPLRVSVISPDVAEVFRDQTGGISTVLWTSDEPFQARPHHPPEEGPTTFTSLQQLPPNPWLTAGMADVAYSVENSSADHAGPGFRIHEPLNVDELSDGRFLFSAAPRVHIRRPVTDELRLRVVDQRLPVQAADPLGGIPVTGTPARLTLQRIEPDEGSAIELEDDWDRVNGLIRIYGGVHLKVGLTFPQNPEIPDRNLLDTAGRRHSMSLFYGPEWMLIDDIVTPGRPHGNDEQSFRLELSIDDRNVAEFFSTLPSDQGKHRGCQDLSQILRAVRPGDTTLHVQAIPSQQANEPFFDEFEPSDIIDIPIHVPKPLEVVLSNYADRFYGSTGNAALALDSGGAFDVICDHGTLTGEVSYHNPYSRSELITLKVHTPEDDYPDVDLFSAFTTMTGFSTAIANLALVVDDGDNVVTVEAWKPVNELMNGGPSVESVTLRAVRPTASALTNALADAVVVKRDIGDVAFTYSNALEGHVSEQVGDGDRFDASPVQSASMVAKSVTLHHFMLRPAPGDHHLDAGAGNDFDQVTGPGVTIHAPAPSITSNGADWIAQPYRERTRLGLANEVGNSDTSVRVPVRIRYALNASVTDASAPADDAGSGIGHHGDSTDSDQIPLDSNPLVWTDRTVTIPLSGNLQVGENGFAVYADNQFTESHPTQYINTIDRRDLVYDCDGALDVLIFSDDHEIQIHVKRVNMDGSRDPLHDSHWPGTTFQIEFQNQPTPLGMLGVIIEPFRLVDEDDDGVAETEVPAVTDLGYQIRGWVTDPNYFHLTPYFVVEPADVVDDSFNVPSLGDTVSFPDQTFWAAVHIAAFDGYKVIVIAFLQQNY